MKREREREREKCKIKLNIAYPSVEKGLIDLEEKLYTFVMIKIFF